MNVKGWGKVIVVKKVSINNLKKAKWGEGGREIQGLEMEYSGAWGFHKARVYDVL